MKYHLVSVWVNGRTVSLFVPVEHQTAKDRETFKVNVPKLLEAVGANECQRICIGG